ncbi:MAG: hypothetical protein PSX81_04370 [bacterium]|nr:hypothetical protein [bacterium]
MEKVISFNLPSSTIAKEAKLRFKNGYIYILINDYLKNENDLVLIREQIKSERKDTFYIKKGISFNEIYDYSITLNILSIFSRNSTYFYNLESKEISELNLKWTNNYRHFFINSNSSITFYEWQIGERSVEDKSIKNYDPTTKKINTIEEISINGINFLGINRGNKYIDISDNTIAKATADKYEIVLKNLILNKYDTLSRTFDKSQFVSSEYIRNIHARYSIKPTLALLDSLDKQCENKSQIYAIKLGGDSILSVLYENKCDTCYWFNKSYTQYLDIWVLDKPTQKWLLKYKGLRLDNHSICERLDVTKLKKEMLYFPLIGIESEWNICGDYMIVPKIMSDKIDLNGDLSIHYTKDGRTGRQNLHLFLFKLGL